MAYKVVFRPAAKADLRQLYDYIASEAGHQVAGQYPGRLEAACLSLGVFPERGTVRDHVFPGLRIIGFERRASIAFVVEGDRVRILRILHRGQDYPKTWSGD